MLLSIELMRLSVMKRGPFSSVAFRSFIISPYEVRSYLYPSYCSCYCYYCCCFSSSSSSSSNHILPDGLLFILKVLILVSVLLPSICLPFFCFCEGCSEGSEEEDEDEEDSEFSRSFISSYSLARCNCLFLLRLR